MQNIPLKQISTGKVSFILGILSVIVFLFDTWAWSTDSYLWELPDAIARIFDTFSYSVFVFTVLSVVFGIHALITKKDRQNAVRGLVISLIILLMSCFLYTMFIASMG